VAGGVISYVANFLLNKLTWDFFYKVCKEKDDENLRIAKTTKACNSFYKAVYYICIVIWGYFVLNDQHYMPPSLLGSGDLSKINARFGTYVWPEGLRVYYLGTMGF
jgi:hypothetical protein